jgi:GntR family transcriptional repressor for pyruvate dehydrogenase complex
MTVTPPRNRGWDVASRPAMIEPVRRLKVADAVAAQLSRLIDGDEYRPGERLPPERELSEQFGVGRSSMREALRSLEADGLVRIEHGIGVFVADKSKRRLGDVGVLMAGDFTVPELFEVRLPLERDAAGLAARRITSQEIDDLHQILERCADPKISDSAFIRLDAELHRGIVKATKNALLSTVMANLEPLFFTYSHHVIALPDRRARAHEGHLKIVDAVAGRRVRDARAAAVDHIRDVERDIVKHLDLGKPPLKGRGD